MADTVTEKVSDERLREIIENTAEALDFLKGWPQFNGVAEKLSMARELLSRRTAPAAVAVGVTCEDEGCPHYGTDHMHVARSVLASPTDEMVEREWPSLEEAHKTASDALSLYVDACHEEEAKWTGWGDQIVPPYAEMRRVKAEQAWAAFWDSDPKRAAIAALGGHHD